MTTQAKNLTSFSEGIADNGNVGIGTTSPAYKLDVASTIQIRAGESLRLQNVAGSSAATIQCAGAGTNSDLGFSTAGSERMRIDSSGDIGLGVTPYSNSKLTIGGTDATGYSSVLMFDNNSSSGAEFFMLATDTAWSAGANKFIMGHGAPSSGNADMTITSDGSVGIGTYNPATKLHVSGGSDNIRLDNTGSGNYGLEILRNGTKSASFAWGEGNANLEIKNYRNDAQADGPYANIDFFTGGTNATSPNFNPDLRMRIQQTGDVGIGTSNPFSKLHINSNGAPATSGNMTTGLTVSNSSGGTAINIGTYDVGGYSYIQSAYVNNAGVARDLGFRIGDTEMLRLNSSSLSLYKKNYGTSSSVVHSGHLTRFRWATQANDTWRTICSMNDFHGRIFVSASDASSGDRAEWSVRVTSPAYGVSGFERIYYHDGGWNTGSFDLRYANISGTYYLQGKASSYYSTSNNFQFDIEFNKSQ